MIKTSAKVSSQTKLSVYTHCMQYDVLFGCTGVVLACSRSRKKVPGRSQSSSSPSRCIRVSSLHCSPDSFSYKASSSSLEGKERKSNYDSKRQPLDIFKAHDSHLQLSLEQNLAPPSLPGLKWRSAATSSFCPWRPESCLSTDRASLVSAWLRNHNKMSLQGVLEATETRNSHTCTALPISTYL